jgi:hypothetical protein
MSLVLEGDKTMLVTFIGALTFTRHVAKIFEPSSAVAVITTLPTPIAVTKPDTDTVANEVEEDDQITDVIVAYIGRTLVVSCIV